MCSRRGVGGTRHRRLGWANALTSESLAEPMHGWLERARREVVEEIDLLTALEADAASRKEYGKAGRYERQRRTLGGRSPGVPASRNVLPKYGFPVDLVPLDSAERRRRRSADRTRSGSPPCDQRLCSAPKSLRQGLWRSIGLASRAGRGGPHGGGNLRGVWRLSPYGERSSEPVACAEAPV